MAVGNATPKMGYSSALGIAEETTLNTFVTSTAFIEFMTEAFKRTREEVKLESINTTRDFKKRIIGNETVEGSIEADLNLGSDGLIYLIKQAMGGTVASASLSADSFEHTLYPGDMENNQSSAGAADVKSLSIAARKGDTDVWNISGARVNSLVIKAEANTPVMVTAEILGMGASITSTIPTVVLSDIVPAIFAGVEIRTGDSIGNVSTEYINSFELTLNNNLDGDQRALGTRNIVQLPATRREMMMTLSQRFDTLTAYNRFIDNTQTAIKILMQTETTIGSTAANTTYSMVIDLPNCYFNSNQPEVGEAGVLVHEIEVTAMYDASTGAVGLFKIQNATANY